MKFVIINSCARYDYTFTGVSIVEGTLEGTPEYRKEQTQKSFSPSVKDVKEIGVEVIFIEPHRKGEIVESDELKNAGILVLDKITDYRHHSEETTIFIDCSDSKTLIDTTLKLNINFDDTSLFKIWREGKIDLKKVMEKFEEGDESYFCTPFNPFGEFSISFNSQLEKKEYYSFVVVLTKILITYLRIGFADGRILKIDKNDYDDWHFNFGIAPLKLFIDYFGLQPVFEDRKRFPLDQFCIDANYRKVVTTHLAKLIANICVANEWARIPSNVKTWYDPEFYVDALKKIEF